MTPDICMCSPTRIEEKCLECHRFNAPPDDYQSYSNLYEDCIRNNWCNFIERREGDRNWSPK